MISNSLPRLVEQIQMGVEGSQARSPHGLVVRPDRPSAQNPRDLAQPALLATDGEHLQAVDACVEGAVGR